MPTRFRAAASLTLLLLTGSAFVSETYAAQPVDSRPRPQERLEVRVDDMDAERTREALMEVLRRHPPSVGRVLKLDPTLMRNDTYLAAYPSLRQFLTQHPDVQQSPSYYLSEVRVGGDGEWQPPTQRQRMLETFLAGAAGFTVFVIVLTTLVWLLRTLLDQRRWNRLSKIQAEVHTKLMDRFATSEELMAYVQTPSGRRFLEAGPVPLEEAPRSIGAPFGRILWSAQVGVVLFVTGLGLLYVSSRAFEEMREFFFIVGALSLALGAGFAVSSLASYILSRRLGLVERRTATLSDHA
jgi:hypothetical protein